MTLPTGTFGIWDFIAGREMRVISVKAAAAYFDVHPNTIYRHIRSGEIPAMRIGRQYRVDVDALREYLRGGATGDA